MPLTVLSVAFPFAPVGPDSVGGAEQILSDLDSALTAAGQTSVVVACQGSRPAGKLFSIPLPSVLNDTDRAWSRKQFQAAIDLALSRHRVDLIHMHGLDFHEYTLPAAIPTLVTLHLPIAWNRPDIWKRFAGRVQFCCVSETQRRSCPAELIAPALDSAKRCQLAVIENGVALPEFSPGRKKENFALAMGRICPEKNAHEALQAGTLADVPVLLAGQVFPYPEHEQYFREKIEPLLQTHPGGVQHEFLGPLSADRSRGMLARARCLLHPTRAPETSSLVAMEALAAGTPVIAYRSGALPHIVEDGVTGFLVDGVEEMAAAVRKAHTISAQACRSAAERRFSKQRMIQRYFDLYQTLLQTTRRERLYA